VPSTLLPSAVSISGLAGRLLFTPTTHRPPCTAPRRSCCSTRRHWLAWASPNSASWRRFVDLERRRGEGGAGSRPWSVTSPVPVTLLPFRPKASADWRQAAIHPDNASATVYGTETSVLFHPAPFAAGVGVPQLNVGGVNVVDHAVVRAGRRRGSGFPPRHALPPAARLANHQAIVGHPGERPRVVRFSGHRSGW